jgi:hypothetical protein
MKGRRNLVKNSNQAKHADDVLVTDGAAAMRKTILATRGALAVPKSKIDALMEKEKNGRHKRK